MIYRQGLAIAIRVLPFIAILVCFNHDFQAQTAKTDQVRTHPPGVAKRMARQQRLTISHNQAGALRSLQTLFACEATYQSTTGNGDYGTLDELRKQGLIDQVLVEGHRYGYLSESDGRSGLPNLLPHSRLQRYRDPTDGLVGDRFT